MRRLWPFVSDGNRPAQEAQERASASDSAAEPEDAIELTSCGPFETILVKTLQSIYEIVVISRHSGQVLVRGGRLFPEYRPAILTGSTAGGSAVKVGCIEPGLRLELSIPGEVVRTSPVQSVLRAAASHS
jgi:hypothetical protein